MNAEPKMETSAQSTTGPTFRPSVSDLLLVTLSTLVGYFTAFSYHREYAMAFGIPPDLISFNPSSLLVAAYNIWVFILSVGVFLIWVYLAGGQPKTPFDARAQRLAPAFLYIVIALNLYEGRTVRNSAILVAVLILYYEFVRPLLKYRHVKGYAQKLRKADEENFSEADPNERSRY